MIHADLNLMIEDSATRAIPPSVACTFDNNCNNDLNANQAAEISTGSKSSEFTVLPIHAHTEAIVNQITNNRVNLSPRSTSLISLIILIL